MRINREEMIRVEIRHSMDMMLKVIQWGVTVLIAIQTANYYIRKDFIERLIKSKILPEHSMLLPFKYHVIGTFILIVMALIFYGLNYRTSQRYRLYKKELIIYGRSGVKDQKISWWLRPMLQMLFFTFPIMDLGIWIYIHHGHAIKVVMAETLFYMWYSNLYFI